jgi:basic membrane lipoprotein Med (substrate-binding protein (PBP1-ABC) superfamily)
MRHENPSIRQRRLRMKRIFNLLLALAIVTLMVTGVFAESKKESGGDEGISIGVVMWGFHDEGVWDTNAYDSLVKLSKKYPVEIGYSEEIDMKEIESTLRARAEMDDIVWAHSSGYEDAVKRVAPDYPDTIFMVEYALDRGKDYYPKNVVTIGQDPEEACFLVGALSAKMSKSKKLGVIQAMNDPLDTLYSAAYRDGAHHVDSSIQVSRVIIEAYLDPVKTRDAVKAFVEKGVDAVFVSMDDMSGTLEAKAQGIYSTQHYKDVTDQAPDTILNNAIWKFDGALEMIVKAIQEKRFDEFRSKTWFIPLSLQDGTTGLGTYGKMVPEETRSYVEDLKKQIIEGKLTVMQKYEW